MIVFPAIDLKGGEVVRLAEGDMDRATIYGDNPGEQAARFAEAGASWLHVVDLDGAFAGEAVNAHAVESILQRFPGKVQLGGGIRTREGAERWLELGVARVVIGTAALKDPNVDEAVTQCLQEIAAESDILQYIESPYVRLAIAWGGALVTSIRKTPRILNVTPVGPRQTRAEDSLQPRPRRRAQAGKIHCLQPPSSDDEKQI